MKNDNFIYYSNWQFRMNREIRGFDWLKHANYHVELHNNPSGVSLQTIVISFFIQINFVFPAADSICYFSVIFCCFFFPMILFYVL